MSEKKIKKSLSVGNNLANIDNIDQKFEDPVDL